MDARIVVSAEQFDELLEMLERPPVVSIEQRREVAAARRRRPTWFPPDPLTLVNAPYLSPAEREFIEGAHAGRH